MQLTKSLSWYEYPFNCICYFIASTADHLLVFVAGCLVLLFISPCLRVGYGRLFKHWAAFSSILLLVGAEMGGLWDCLIYGHFYVTADYLSDFSPFVPIMQGVIDVHFDDYSGHLIGVTMRQLQFIWLLFALATWTVAAGIYFRLRRPPILSTHA